MHECPQRDCQQIVPDTFIACLNHWYAVPQAFRDAVAFEQERLDSVRNGLLSEHARNAAIQDAIDAMNRVPDEPRVLWEECGMRCMRYGTKNDWFIRFESGLYNQDTNVTDWQEVTASQIGLLLGVLGEHFEKACQIAERAREADYATP